ncbi:hypothetical protein L6R50_17460 [Myxococcota bacterium]|nr:hypothetical protein [Myxococcota bacterium]
MLLLGAACHRDPDPPTPLGDVGGGDSSDAPLGGDGVTEGWAGAAMDPETGVVWTLQVEDADDSEHFDDGLKTLHAISLGGSESTWIASMLGSEDEGLLFLGDRVVLLSEYCDGETLTAFDSLSMEFLRSVELPYHWDRVLLSPSGRFLAAVDQGPRDRACEDDPDWDDEDGPWEYPLQVVDLETFETLEVPYSGEYVDAVWAHGRDELITASGPVDGPTPFVWVRRLEVSPGRDVGGPFEAAETRVVPVAGWSLWGAGFGAGTGPSFAVSPDDRFAIVALKDQADPTRFEDTRFAVLDTASGPLYRVEHRHGPVLFAEGGNTLVAIAVDGGGSTVQLIDSATGARRELRIEAAHPSAVLFDAGIVGDGAAVLAGWRFGGGYVLVDVATGEPRIVDGDVEIDPRSAVDDPGTGFTWLHGPVRLDVVAGTLETFPGAPVGSELLGRFDALGVPVYRSVSGSQQTLLYLDPLTGDVAWQATLHAW